MPLLASDLTSMRATVTAHLPDTADIYRLTETDDGMGGTTTPTVADSTPLYSGVAFLLSPNSQRGGSGDENPRSGGIWADSDWLGTMPFGTDIRESDIVVSGGKQFDVTRDTSGRTNELQVKVGLVRRGEG